MNYVSEVIRPKIAIFADKLLSRQMAHGHNITFTGWGRGLDRYRYLCLIHPYVCISAPREVESHLSRLAPFKSSLGPRKNQPYGGLLR